LLALRAPWCLLTWVHGNRGGKMRVVDESVSPSGTMTTCQMTFGRTACPSVVFSLLPGPTRKRMPSPYCYRLTYCSPDPAAPGCALLWDVLGGRLIYQVALERRGSGALRWHCTCADAVYRGERAPHVCKHVRGLLEQGRPRGD
jgi:hypothetical protein